MLVCSDARIDDGNVDICLLREAGRLEFLRAFPQVFLGGIRLILKFRCTAVGR